MARKENVKILIAEDDRNLGRYIKESVESFGFNTVEIVISAEEAIQKAIEIEPDIVFMDIVLKGKMDGIEAAQVIKEQLATSIIYITAYSDIERVKRAKATKPIGYLLKPFQMSDLQQGIEFSLHN